jgi:hypothetical protein
LGRDPRNSRAHRQRKLHVLIWTDPVASTLVTRREQFHQSRLVENLQHLHATYPDYALHVGSALGSTAGSTTTLASIYEKRNRSSDALVVLDNFKVFGLVITRAVAFVAAGQAWLGRQSRGNGALAYALGR